MLSCVWGDGSVAKKALADAKLCSICFKLTKAVALSQVNILSLRSTYQIMLISMRHEAYIAHQYIYN
jgi:hypothetical protein